METTVINEPAAAETAVSESTEMDVMREVQSRRRKITVEEYALMMHTGVFHPDERVELIEGELIQMAPMKSPHISQVSRLTRFFIEKLGRNATVFVQLPVVLGEHSEPEPDFSILAWRDDDYFARKPTASDVYLLVEVADSSLLFDRRTKLPLYARHRVPEVWIVNLQEAQLEIYREPKDGAYSEKRIVKSGEAVSIQAFPAIAFAVSELMIQAR